VALADAEAPRPSTKLNPVAALRPTYLPPSLPVLVREELSLSLLSRGEPAFLPSLPRAIAPDVRSFVSSVPLWMCVCVCVCVLDRLFWCVLFYAAVIRERAVDSYGLKEEE
jgi:hypothetical protein